MKNFVDALKSRKGFEFLTSYEKYSELTKNELIDIAKELIYAIEESGQLEETIEEIYETAAENLIAQYDDEFLE